MVNSKQAIRTYLKGNYLKLSQKRLQILAEKYGQAHHEFSFNQASRLKYGMENRGIQCRVNYFDF